LFTHVELQAELPIFRVISVYKKNDGDDSTLELAAGLRLNHADGNIGRDKQLQQLEISRHSNKSKDLPLDETLVHALMFVQQVLTGHF
jgi:hypothetical protein